MSDRHIVKVNVFSGATLEEACEKANNLELQYPAAFKNSHLLRDGDDFKIVVITAQYVE